MGHPNFDNLMHFNVVLITMGSHSSLKTILDRPLICFLLNFTVYISSLFLLPGLNFSSSCLSTYAMVVCLTFFFILGIWQALSKTLTVDELCYLKEQFALLEPNKNGTISLENIRAVCFFPGV